MQVHQVPYPPEIRVADLKVQVKALMDMVDGPPPVVGPVGGPALNVKNVLISLVAMMAHCMGSMSVTPSCPPLVNWLIKVFLSAINMLDGRLRDANQTPTWCAKSNFVCLLNLPDTMKRFGPL